jgi:hypothetical protein
MPNRDQWLYWCPHLTLERWREECRLVEERFSLFRTFAEQPFFGFRGIVARAGSEYHVSVAAEMDMYPTYVPWVFVTPPVAGARQDGNPRLGSDQELLKFFKRTHRGDVINTIRSLPLPHAKSRFLPLKRQGDRDAVHGAGLAWLASACAKSPVTPTNTNEAVEASARLRQSF